MTATAEKDAAMISSRTEASEPTTMNDDDDDDLPRLQRESRAMVEFLQRLHSQKSDLELQNEILARMALNCGYDPDALEYINTASTAAGNSTTASTTAAARRNNSNK